jgi:hypothetical protein
VLAGCGFQHGIAATRDSGMTVDALDAAPDAPPDAPPSCWSRWQDGSVSFGAPVLMTDVSTNSYDRDPFVSADDLTIYVSSSRSPSLGDDVWSATRTSPTAQFPTLVQVAELNSPSTETKFSTTQDGLYGVLGSDRTGTVGGIDVWETQRADTGSAWSTPTEAHMQFVNTVFSDQDPLISADGLRLYLSPSAGGPQYLAVASRATRSSMFSAPSKFNSLYSGTGEADPTVSSDERVIVFTSNRVGSGFAGTNLWYAVRDTNQVPFGTPMPVPVVNTDNFEGDGQLSADGCHLYFARYASSATDWDIYVATQQ